ncbi:hypothetical protein H1C71_004222 [Ictidomys tridecemlineatus]|nr:hypothetical protein H1C71_004222 [Ictidomys tridecemlineatus]
MEDTEISFIILALIHAWLSPLSTYCTREVHLSWSMSLDLHAIVTKFQKYTLGVYIGVVCSMGLNKCIMICIYYYGVIQSSFTAFKILCALPIHPSIPLNTWKSLNLLLSA